LYPRAFSLAAQFTLLQRLEIADSSCAFAPSPPAKSTHSKRGILKRERYSIGKYVKNGLLRSPLITGAMAVVAQVSKRTAVTRKEAWIQALVARRGKKCAAVALANKTVRTAFAMLTQGSEYKAEPIVS